MIRVGLTGGIGSGKSTVAKVFEVLGIPVYYADTATRQLMNTDSGVRKAIIENFGEESYRNNQLNRGYIASVVFNNHDKLNLLNAITHPATFRDAETWMNKQQTPYAIKEAALIFESGSAEQLDYVIGVYAPKALRIKRVMDRDGVSKEDVLKRMNRQINEEMKMKLCDFIITNNEEEMVLPQIMSLHKQLLAIAGE